MKEREIAARARRVDGQRVAGVIEVQAKEEQWHAALPYST